MPRVPKTANVVERKRGRKPVSRVSKPRVQVPSVRKDAGRGNSVALSADNASTGTNEQQSNGTEEKKHGPVAGLSAETLAAIAAAETPAGAVGESVTNGPETGTPPAGVPAAIGPTLEECQQEARMWFDTLDALAQAHKPAAFVNTTRTLHEKATRDNVANALGGVMHFYGLTGLEIASHPLGQLAVASLPFLIAGYLDWSVYKATKAAAEAATAAPVPPVGAGAASSVTTPLAPASDLHSKI